MHRTILVLAALAVLPLAPAAARDGKPDKVAVAKAIERGATWLRETHKGDFRNDRREDVPELVLLTLAHAGVSHQDPVFQKALEATLGAKLRHTYRVATQAMALSKINPWLHRARLAHCAQWLVDTQLVGGEWGYPGNQRGQSKQAFPEIAAPVTKAQAEGGPKSKPIEIVSRFATGGRHEDKGDFSNTQFALLGLRACAQARIVMPKETWEAAMAYQLRFQQEDGSFGYVMGGEQDGVGYTSLTAAGVCGIAICHHGQGKRNAKGHPAVKKGLKWLATHWTPSENTGVTESSIVGPSDWQYYHLYSIERVGQVLGLKKIGRTPWYAAGANWILAQQAGDGSWRQEGRGPARIQQTLHTADTCFAILFLSLSTAPLTG